MGKCNVNIEKMKLFDKGKPKQHINAALLQIYHGQNKDNIVCL